MNTNVPTPENDTNMSNATNKGTVELGIVKNTGTGLMMNPARRSR